MPLEPLDEKPKGVAHFNLSNLRGEIDVLIALEQNHRNLVLFPLVSRNDRRSSIPQTVSSQQLQFLSRVRVVRQSRVRARVELVEDEAAVLVEASVDLNLVP